MNDKTYILEITENDKVIKTLYFKHWQEREIYKLWKGLK
jgi:hypothetical protein